MGFSYGYVDNGIGFNEANFNSFKTLDSDYKIEKGGRGIGRLLWLKAFDRVEVNSCFLNDNDEMEQRTFSFSRDGIEDHDTKDAHRNAKRETVVRLVDFNQDYRTRKTGDAIAKSMVEHCLWYFARSGGAPKIIVHDEDQEILLDDLFENLMHSSAVTDQIQVKDSEVELLHVQLRANTSMAHLIAYCANDRLVTTEKLSNYFPGLPSKIGNEEDEFVYMCYISSDLLNERVRPERDTFDISIDSPELFEDTEVSWHDIRNGVITSITAHLQEHLDLIKKRAQNRIHEFVSTKAPRYKPVLQYLEPDKLNIDPMISDNKLELTLHGKYTELEERILTEGYTLMEPHNGESIDDYQTRIEDYLKKVVDVKKSALASYVTNRRVIIDLLKAAIERGPDERYVRENLIHKLIMPMRTDSSEVLQDDCNLWLIDERLAFHDYLASDKPLSAMPVTGSSSAIEPDLVALNVFDNPILVGESLTPPLASIVVIELKRPMRNDAAEGKEKDPIEQALGYLEEIRRGTVRTAQGRPIPNSEDIPGFCYVICDLTPSIVKRCNMHDLTRTSDGLGYFSYKKNYQSYVEVMSFDRLVNMASERHRAFFDKLGLPVS